MQKLTVKQQKFTDEYIISGNATQAIEYIKRVLAAKGNYISYWSNDPVNRVNVDNGITLCRKCHAFEHRGESVHNLIANLR